MIGIKGLDKRFGKLDVLKSIDLDIETGKVTAIVGPNGSGKTTLIKCILGLVKPDRGAITVNGRKLNGDWNYRNFIGYMPQLARFPDNLTGKEVLLFLRDLRHLSGSYDPGLQDSFQLNGEMDKPLRTLSGGTRQKISAMIAFHFNSRILILDEPTAGLDPVSSSRLKDRILKEKNAGKTIILTSHIMSEVEELADDIVFLLEGKIHFRGSKHDILQNTKEIKLERAIAQMLEGASE